MNLTFLIYLADVMGGLSFLLLSLGLPTFLITSFVFILSHDSSHDEDTSALRFRKVGPKIIVTSLICLFVSALLPSRDAIYLMAASEGVQEIAANPRVQELASNSIKLLENKIKSELNDKSESNTGGHK